MSTLFNLLDEERLSLSRETFSLEEYLAKCSKDHMCYATAAERMLADRKSVV